MIPTPHSSSEGSESAGSLQGTWGSGEPHTFPSLPRAATLYDSILLIVAFQPGFAQRYLGLLLENTESYPRDSVNQE